MAKSAAYYRRKKHLAKKRREAQRAAAETDSSSFSEASIERQLCYLVPAQYITYDSYLQAQYEEFWQWYAPWYAQPQVEEHPQVQSTSYATLANEGKWDGPDFDLNRYFGPVPYHHENLKYMTKGWWEGVWGWFDGTQRGWDDGEEGKCEKGGIARDDWGCDFCGVECFCWTVGL